MDLLERRILNLRNIRFVVLDEVDRMLDIGFREDIRRILSGLKDILGRSDTATQRRSDEGEPPAQGPAMETALPGGKTHQTMFVSATIAEEIEKLARTYMHEPIEKLIAPGVGEKPMVAEVEQFYLSVEHWDKYRLLKMLLERENPDLAIVFCRTKHGADKLARKLHADGILCREIHGDLRRTSATMS